WRGQTIGFVKNQLEHPGGGNVPDNLTRVGGLPLAGLNSNLALAGLFKKVPLLPPPVDVKKELSGKKGLYEAMQKSLFDWQSWTGDRIEPQLDPSNPRVWRVMEQEHPGALAAFDELLGELEELANSGKVERKVRRLEKPESVTIRYYGE